MKWSTEPARIFTGNFQGFESHHRKISPAVSARAQPPKVDVYESTKTLGKEAARAGATLVQEAIRKQGRARLLFSAANSQLDMVESLAANTAIDWSAVDVFHVDEYVGLASSHPESFGGW